MLSPEDLATKARWFAQKNAGRYVGLGFAGHEDVQEILKDAYITAWRASEEFSRKTNEQ